MIRTVSLLPRRLANSAFANSGVLNRVCGTELSSRSYSFTPHLLFSSSAAGSNGEADDQSSTSVPSPDYSNKSLSGTPSPWAVFDAWGANEVFQSVSQSEIDLLGENSVRIPTMGEDGELLTDSKLEDDGKKVTEILGAYDKLMKRRSSVQFGYPYNLM